jgi:hypothetical protein
MKRGKAVEKEKEEEKEEVWTLITYMYRIPRYDIPGIYRRGCGRRGVNGNSY